MPERGAVTGLLAAGWACCPTWQAGDSLQTVLDMETVLAGLGAAPSNTVYFEEGAYTQAYDTDLVAAGYTSVIHHGEESLPLVTSDTANPVWHPGAVGLQGEEPRFRLEDAVEEKGNIISREDELYDSNPFISMLNYLQAYGARSEVSVMKPWEAVFCQVLFPEKSVGIPFFQQVIFPAFSGHYASLRMRACSIR